MHIPGSKVLKCSPETVCACARVCECVLAALHCMLSASPLSFLALMLFSCILKAASLMDNPLLPAGDALPQ